MIWRELEIGGERSSWDERESLDDMERARDRMRGRKLEIE
jgi:hypothetical protein